VPDCEAGRPLIRASLRTAAPRQKITEVAARSGWDGRASTRHFTHIKSGEPANDQDAVAYHDPRRRDQPWADQDGPKKNRCPGQNLRETLLAPRPGIVRDGNLLGGLGLDLVNSQFPAAGSPATGGDGHHVHRRTANAFQGRKTVPRPAATSTRSNGIDRGVLCFYTHGLRPVRARSTPRVINGRRAWMRPYVLDGPALPRVGTYVIEEHYTDTEGFHRTTVLSRLMPLARVFSLRRPPHSANLGPTSGLFRSPESPSGLPAALGPSIGGQRSNGQGPSELIGMKILRLATLESEPGHGDCLA